MNAHHLSCLSLFSDCIILSCVRLISVFFLLIINRESHGAVFTNRQMRRDYKIKFTDKSKANLKIWIHLDLAKVHRLKMLTSPYIVSYPHFLNLINILTLPKLLLWLKLGLIWDDLCLPRFLVPDLHTCALVYEIKTNASHLYECKNKN